MPVFTETEQRIIKVLADGMRHSRKELHGCLNDELTNLATLRQHMCNMRKKLRPVGQDILCEVYQGTLYYRHIRLLCSSNE